MKAGGVAHDFNNMLMVLSGSAELLDRSFPPDALSRIYLDQIQRTITKAAAVTRQLLAFSRKQILDIKPMDLHVALQASLARLPTLLGADVRINFAPGAQDLDSFRHPTNGAGDCQSGHQRARRYAGRGRSDDFHAQRDGGACVCPGRFKDSQQLGCPGGSRYRSRDGFTDARAHL